MSLTSGQIRTPAPKKFEMTIKGMNKDGFRSEHCCEGKNSQASSYHQKQLQQRIPFQDLGCFGVQKKTGEQKFSSLSLSFGLHPLAASTSRKVLSITSFLWVIAQVIFSLLGRKKLVVLATFVCKVEAFVPSKKSSQ